MHDYPLLEKGLNTAIQHAKNVEQSRNKGLKY